MAEVREQAVRCPYCGETISVLIDDSVQEQTYIEDCEVCCRPIEFTVIVGLDGDVSVSVAAENE
jgi:hypothetical protein